MIYSRKFKVSESVFRIKVYPNGDTSEAEGDVSVYLLKESNWRVRCSDGEDLLSLKNEVSSIKTDMKDTREEFSRQLNDIKNRRRRRFFFEPFPKSRVPSLHGGGEAANETDAVRDWAHHRL